MIKMILLHFFKAIATLEKSVSEEYVVCLNRLIDFYQLKRIRQSSIDDLMEYADSLGKFGQSAINRKISVYLITNVIRISIEKMPQLYRRLLFLCDDSDRLVRFEVAFQLRYVLSEESNSKEYIKKNFVPYLLNYFNEDNDLAFKSILIETILINIKKFHNDFIDALSKKVDDIFSINDFHIIDNDFNYFIEIFLAVLHCALNEKEYRYALMANLTKFLRRFYKVNELKSSLHVIKTLRIDYCIMHFDIIAKVYIEENEVLFLGQLISSLLRYAFIDDKHTALFYSVLDRIIIQIEHSKELLSNYFLKTAFYFFDVFDSRNEPLDVLSNSTNAYCNSNNVSMISSYYQKDAKDLWMNNFDGIIKSMIDNDNDAFFQFFLSKEKTFEKIMMKCDDWRKQRVIFKALQLIPQYITYNYTKYPNYDETLMTYFNLSKEFLLTRRNYILEQEIMRFIAIILPYAQTKCSIVEYMNEFVLFHQSYFRRRLAVYFFETVFNTLSLDYMRKVHLYQNSIGLINDTVPLIQASMITLFTNNLNRDNEVNEAIEMIAFSKDRILNESLENYKEMHKKGLLTIPELNAIKEKEDQRVAGEKRIKEIERKVNEIRQSDYLYWMKKKRPKMKQNASAIFSVKKTFSKQSTLSSKLSIKPEDQGNKSKRKSSVMSMQSSLTKIGSKDVKIAKYYIKPTTPKTLKELNSKK